MGYMTSLVACFLLAYLCGVEACIRLDAESSSNYFDSHDGYPLFSYTNFYDECWIVKAPSGKKVRAWSDALDTENCADDLNVYCGSSSSGEFIDQYCEGDHLDDITSSGREMYFKFETDSSLTSGGFRIYYKAVSSSESSCYSSGGLSVGAIVGIVFACLVVLGIIIAVVVCVVVSQKKRHGTVHPVGGPIVTTVSPATVAYSGPGYSGQPVQPVQPPPYGMGQSQYNPPPQFSAGVDKVGPGAQPPAGQYPPPQPAAGQDPAYPPPAAVYPPPPPNPY